MRLASGITDDRTTTAALRGGAIGLARMVTSVLAASTFLLAPLSASAKERVLPDPQAAAQMSITAATDIIQRGTLWYWADANGEGDQALVAITAEGLRVIQFTKNGLWTTPNPCPYEAFAPAAESAAALRFSSARKEARYIAMTAPDVRRCGSVGLGASSREAAIPLLNAFLRLKNSSLAERQEATAQEAAQFKAIAEAYRAASPKPSISEDVHRLQVQAEAALRDRQFGEAATDYLDGLKIAPWWPEGHFNLALVFGETRFYALAIEQMRRYLALMPDAADARAAQDKIYEWEPQAKRIADASEAAAQTPKKGK